jgi:AbrB family looped-hinge helix DNA binding protein
MPALTISTKGSVVIPAELRLKYHLTPGRQVHIVDYGGTLALIPVLDDPIVQARGMLKGGPSLTAALVEEHKNDSQP